MSKLERGKRAEKRACFSKRTRAQIPRKNFCFEVE
jgi:hypothetical protein